MLNNIRMIIGILLTVFGGMAMDTPGKAWYIVATITIIGLGMMCHANWINMRRER